MNRKDVLARYEKLYTAVLCDALDDLGLWEQTLDRSIGPLYATCEDWKIVGFAKTLRATTSDALGSWLPDTYRRWTAGYDNVGSEDVLVIAVDKPHSGAVFGQLRTERMKRLGCRGLVTNGLVRDTPAIRSKSFPIFCAGRTPEDCRGRLEYAGHDEPVQIGKVTVRPGDLIVADFDGIVVVPSEVIEDVLERAEAHDAKHEWIHEQLASGRPASQVMETYARPAERRNSLRSE